MKPFAVGLPNFNRTQLDTMAPPLGRGYAYVATSTTISTAGWAATDLPFDAETDAGMTQLVRS